MADTDQNVEQKSEQDQSKTAVQSVDLPEASQGATPTSQASIDILLDMDVPITVVIGKSEIPVRRLLQLGPGAVLRLNKPVEAPADLYLKDTPFATGTIVVVEDQFAVRINEILNVTQTEVEQNAE